MNRTSRGKRTHHFSQMVTGFSLFFFDLNIEHFWHLGKFYTFKIVEVSVCLFSLSLHIYRLSYL